ncbi:MAG: hypothetical protein Q4C70_01460 [Planctomycetia bacterium]|nr:hypothetical protein [Planctomycetia bacterium]
MSKTTYKNTLTIPNSSSDEVANGSTVGGDIVVNFKALADIVHKSSSSSSSGVVLGTSTANTASGTYSASVGGYNNSAYGIYSVTIGGCSNYNYKTGAVMTGYYAYNNYIDYGFISNQDSNYVNIGGLTFTKGVTIGSNSTYTMTIPTGGSMILKVQEMVPSLNNFSSYELFITPTVGPYLSRYNTSGNGDYCYYIDFYYLDGTLEIRNRSSYPAQFGLFGTICGQVLDDYYYYY